MMRVTFSQRLVEAMRAKGAETYHFAQAAKAVAEAPKGEFEVDASDDMLSILGMPVSFLRNHETHEAIVMTIEEAQKLDQEALA